MTTNKIIIQSPLNYTGGKYKLLPQILPLFPQHINVFVDLFCGGCNVGINVDSNKVIYNDTDSNLMSMLSTFRDIDKNIIFDWINEIITKYELSSVSKFGYKYYNCDSGKGVGEYNKLGFVKLKENFNVLTISQSKDYYYYIMLYVLIVYAFNNQIRFNRRGEFNLPVGKRDFNTKMQTKLSTFIDRIKEQDNQFTCSDYKNFDVGKLGEDDLIYVDPPYLITCATYNEQGGWNETNERELLNFLDSLDKKGIRFALSNVLRSKGKENTILLDWLIRNNDKYCVEHLHYDYSNSNYQTKDKSPNSQEVLIRNYHIL